MIKTTIAIEGMVCSMCEAHVNEAIRSVCDTKKLRSSHKTGTTELVTEQPVSEETLCHAIEEAGYRVLSVTAQPYVKRGLFGW